MTASTRCVKTERSVNAATLMAGVLLVVAYTRWLKLNVGGEVSLGGT